MQAKTIYEYFEHYLVDEAKMLEFEEKRKDVICLVSEIIEAMIEKSLR